MNITTHITKNEKGRRSNLEWQDQAPGYGISLTYRWLVERASTGKTIDCTSTNGNNWTSGRKLSKESKLVK